MTVLLTGGAGFIGSHTYLALLEAGHQPVIVDNFSNSNPKILEKLKQITGLPVICHRADVRDEAALSAVFEKHRLTAVIHFAGYKAVGESVGRPLAYYRNNLDSTLALCEVMKRYGVTRLVFSSSATVYGATDRMPLKENMPTGCTNPYGWTKYMNEQILRDMTAANPDWSVALLRYFNPVGAHESGLVREEPTGIPNNLMPYITQVACGKLPELIIFGGDYPTGDGTGVRDYIHVMDLAAGHLAACGFLSDRTGCEAFNLGTGIGYSVLQVVDAFQRVNGVRIPYRIGPRRPGDIARCYADPARAQTMLRWRAKKNLDDMCRDSWRFQQMREH
ncbi:MAG: UDP-glucose 4-epimerase GalE [Clostridia bacterium]|nr:UDP-glucose 4-epimerase GalE [Clostridia bacterium]